jgi:hypothetical protein
MKQHGLHENLAREEAVAGPSNRNFGVTFAAVFGLLAALKLYQGSPWLFVWGGASLAVLAIALLRADILAPLNRAWLKLGLLLYKVVNPIVMMILFYVTILPIGLIMRLLGKDLLRLKRDAAAKSYWLPRSDDRPMSDSMRQQF